jgi:hypothetical protein
VLSFVWLEAELEFDWRHQWRRRAAGMVSRTMYIQTN